MKHGWNHAFFPKPVGKRDHHISHMKQIAYGCFLFAKNIQAQFRFRQRFHKYVLVNYVPGICVVPSSSPREMTVNSDWGVSLLIQWQWSCANVGTSLYPRTQSLYCACWLDEIVPDRWWKGTKTPGTCVYRRLLSHVVSLLGPCRSLTVLWRSLARFRRFIRAFKLLKNCQGYAGCSQSKVLSSKFTVRLGDMIFFATFAAIRCSGNFYDFFFFFRFSTDLPELKGVSRRKRFVAGHIWKDSC